MVYRAALFGAAFALTPVPVLAGIGPEIAYQEQHQNGDEIYLINSDGTARTLLYKGPPKQFIKGLDLKPGGGEIAFLLQYKLMILGYDGSGQKLGAARAIPSPCPILVVDYHPTDGSVAYMENCPNSIYRIRRLQSNAAAPDPNPLVTASGPTGGHWSRHSGKLYYTLAGQGVLAYDPATGTSSAVQPNGWDVNDVLQQGEQSVWNISGGPANLPQGTYKIGDLSSGVQRDGCRLATSIHFGNSDNQMVFRTPPASGGYYVLVQNADCSGAPFQLTGKGAFYYVDWRAP